MGEQEKKEYVEKGEQVSGNTISLRVCVRVKTQKGYRGLDQVLLD